MRKLADIAEVRAGYTFRKPEKGTELFPYPVIQIKDITPDGKLNSATVSTIFLPGLFDKQLVWSGEVVLSARGTRNRAAVYNGEFQEAVAGTQFWIIRPKKGGVLPEFLAWYLNQPQTQQYFAARTHGTYIGMIQKEAVNELRIPVPPIETQQKIVAVHELALREQGAMEQLKNKRAELVSTLCTQAAEKFSTGSKI